MNTSLIFLFVGYIIWTKTNFAILKLGYKHWILFVNSHDSRYPEKRTSDSFRFAIYIDLQLRDVSWDTLSQRRNSDVPAS